VTLLARWVATSASTAPGRVDHPRTRRHYRRGGPRPSHAKSSVLLAYTIVQGQYLHARFRQGSRLWGVIDQLTVTAAIAPMCVQFHNTSPFPETVSLRQPRARPRTWQITKRYGRTTPAAAPLSLHNKRIGSLKAPATVGQFRPIPTERGRSSGARRRLRSFRRAVCRPGARSAVERHLHARLPFRCQSHDDRPFVFGIAGP
jgi:hypothetical protein